MPFSDSITSFWRVVPWERYTALYQGGVEDNFPWVCEVSGFLFHIVFMFTPLSPGLGKITSTNIFLRG